MANEEKIPVVIAQNPTSTAYANVFNVQYLDGGIALSCGVSQAETRTDQEGNEHQVLGVYLENRIMLTIDSAARLAQTLSQAVQNIQVAQASINGQTAGKDGQKYELI